MDSERRTPVSLAVFVSLGISMLLLVAAIAIGGSYALTLGVIHRDDVAHAQIAVREATFQIRQAVPTCRAINAMDQASQLPATGFPSPPHNAYDKRLSAAIHSVNVTSHCPLILSDVARHVPFTEILRQIRGG